MDNVFVKLKSGMPGTVKGFVKIDPAGDYNVYINDTLNYEQQMAALAHEVMHIKSDHLRVNMPAWLCEREVL